MNPQKYASRGLRLLLESGGFGVSESTEFLAPDIRVLGVRSPRGPGPARTEVQCT